MSIQDPKQKAEFLKYMSQAGFLLHNILAWETTIDERVEELLGWLNK